MVKLKGETPGERQKDWYKKRKIDIRNMTASNVAYRAVNDAMSFYMSEMDVDHFDLVDVTIVMNAVLEHVGMYMKHHAFEHVMVRDGVFIPQKKEKMEAATKTVQAPERTG